MKYLSLIAIACLLVVSSCSSKQSKAETLVKDYLQKSLNDPKSYESVQFGELYQLSADHHGRSEIVHTYRAKNALGGTLTKTDCFQIDSAFTEARCCFVSQQQPK